MFFRKPAAGFPPLGNIGRGRVKKSLVTAVMACAVLAAASAGTPAVAQVKQTREQILFYTSDWKGDRFPDGRPKIPDSLLTRALDVPIEDIWGFLRAKGYNCQFDSGWQSLHPDKPFAGRALTAQYMPLRPDMYRAIQDEGKKEGRVSGNNSWPINELTMGDVYVADGFGKIVEGTLIGSNLGSGIAAHTHSGFVFDAGIRDAEENREIENLNGVYRAYDPSAWKDMTLTAINTPIRIGRATVLPGDLVLVKHDGVIFIPAILAEDAISSAEFTQLEDAYNFELNKSGKNGGEFEGGWTPTKYDAMAAWAKSSGKVRMPQAEFDKLLAERKARNAKVTSEAPKK
jgi:regulator of RNase E activity RraA